MTLHRTLIYRKYQN